MKMDDMWTEVETHVKAALNSLPMPAEEHHRRTLAHHFEAGDWRQVCYWLRSLAREKGIDEPRFLRELLLTEEALREHHRAGMRAVLLSAAAEWEKRVIGECLRAVAYGPFFQEPNTVFRPSVVLWDSDFELVFGMTGEELTRVADLWPDVDSYDEDVYYAINGSFNNLFGYPHGKHHLWSEYISATPEEAVAVYDWFRRTASRNRDRPQPNSAGHAYFLNLT